MEDQLTIQGAKSKDKSLVDLLRQACKKIAPVWPLENFVAVNPYLGLIDQKFNAAAQQLESIGGIQMTLPTAFYLNKMEQGIITRNEIAAVLYKKPSLDIDLDTFIQNLDEGDEQPTTISSLTDVATHVTEHDWNRFVTSRVSVWAASYFDNGQAIWIASDQSSDLFLAWKKEAEIDRTSEVAGLKGFRKAVKALPDDPLQAAKLALDILHLPENGIPLYLHRLLLSVGGWAAHAARLDWDSELQGGKDGKLIEFLAVLLSWEVCLFQSLDSPKLRVKWNRAKKILVETINQQELNYQLTQNLILQEAFELASQREIIEKLNSVTTSSQEQSKQAKAQAVFCIDVRSEVYRRNLELVDQSIETIGFAGFFGFPINFVPLAHASGEAQCPVLIESGPTILEEIHGKEANDHAYNDRVLKKQVQQIWKSFKSGAVTCFSFVSPIGLSYLPKLFTDSFGLTRPVPHPDKAGLKSKDLKNKGISLEAAIYNDQTTGIPLEQRVQMAKNALSAMSLTDNFARFVLITGHGSTTVNNPHATGLDCGACGGHSGEANAKVAAAVLNDLMVREDLKDHNIFIPDNTVFLACLHDTTTDEISIFNEYDIPVNRTDELLDLKNSLAKAGHASRTERAMRMSVTNDIDVAIKARSKDWSQVRPEWGLAGCSTFVVAPRERTKNIDFGGQSFLHSYDWKKDDEFSILELIMTAPMVVTSWINLQYYASTVDNKNFGSGNKTLHNVTAGLGVLEGFSGDLRVGLPIQSVHDGEKYQHEPLKLNVVIEAPIEAMETILKKHKSVRDLCDNGWIHLLAMDELGKVSHRYEGNYQWQAL